MNAAAVEKIAGDVISGLKNQPMIMALLVFNLMVLGLVFYAVNAARHKEERLMTLVLGQQSEAMKMLASCKPRP